MTILLKFGKFDSDGNEMPHSYQNMWAKVPSGRSDRLVISACENQVAIMLELLKAMSGPFWLLYVHVVSRTKERPGRYQVSNPMSREEIVAFLNAHKNFLENDGRHSVWIKSQDVDGQLVFDRHNLIYAYGPLKEFIMTLNAQRYSEVGNIECPFPHSHHYHQAYDQEATSLLSSREWIVSSLEAQDID